MYFGSLARKVMCFWVSELWVMFCPREAFAWLACETVRGDVITRLVLWELERVSVFWFWFCHLAPVRHQVISGQFPCAYFTVAFTSTCIQRERGRHAFTACWQCPYTWTRKAPCLHVFAFLFCVGSGWGGVLTTTLRMNTQAFVFVYIKTMRCLHHYVFTQKTVHVIAIIKQYPRDFHAAIAPRAHRINPC